MNVLVGPTGVYVLEIKAYSGFHRYSTGQWQVMTHDGTWRDYEQNPARQVLCGRQHLMSFFASQGLVGTVVKPVVVWAGKGELDIVGRVPVSIWFLSRSNSLQKIKSQLQSGQADLSAEDLVKLDYALGWAL